MDRNLTTFDLPDCVKKNLERANVKTIEQFYDLPIDIVYKLCNKEKSVLIEVLEKIDAVII